MIQVAAFKPEDYAKANKFLQEHPSASGEGKGIAYCNEYLLVSYEDGNLFPVAEQRTRLQGDLTILYKQRFDSVKEIALWKAQLDTFEPRRKKDVEKFQKAYSEAVKDINDEKLRRKAKEVEANPTPDAIGAIIQSIGYKDKDLAQELFDLQREVEMNRMKASESNASFLMQTNELEITEIKIAAAEKLLKTLK